MFPDKTEGGTLRASRAWPVSQPTGWQLAVLEWQCNRISIFLISILSFKRTATALFLNGICRSLLMFMFQRPLSRTREHVDPTFAGRCHENVTLLILDLRTIYLSEYLHNCAHLMHFVIASAWKQWVLLIYSFGLTEAMLLLVPNIFCCVAYGLLVQKCEKNEYANA